MQIFFPGRAAEGFASLDALVAVIVLALLGTVLLFWVGTLAKVRTQREGRLQLLYAEEAVREETSWLYETFQED